MKTKAKQNLYFLHYPSLLELVEIATNFSVTNSIATNMSIQEVHLHKEKSITKSVIKNFSDQFSNQLLNIPFRKQNRSLKLI